MELFNNFKDIIDAARGRVLLTPYGKLNLAKKKDRRKLERQVVELQRSTDSLTRKDIGDWRAAWQMAINVDSPNRQRLYDIYRDVEVDLHLSGCIQQRRGFVIWNIMMLKEDISTTIISLHSQLEKLKL